MSPLLNCNFRECKSCPDVNPMSRQNSRVVIHSLTFASQRIAENPSSHYPLFMNQEEYLHLKLDVKMIHRRRRALISLSIEWRPLSVFDLMKELRDRLDTYDVARCLLQGGFDTS